MEEIFRVKIEKFEGPLDLLLQLIEKRKLHISDISLATVTDDFLAYINNQEQDPTKSEQKGTQKDTMGASANFIWIASTLLLIKSKSLLPTLTLTEEEEGDIQELEYRLKLYKCFKKIAPSIARSFGQKILLPKQPTYEVKPVFSPDKKCAVPLLYTHIVSIVENLPHNKPKIPQAVVEKVISLEEMVERLSSRITQNLSLSFQTFAKSGVKSEAKDREAKTTLIISFLAMLELVKRGVLEVKQNAHFEDITMEAEQVQTPRYT